MGCSGSKESNREDLPPRPRPSNSGPGGAGANANIPLATITHPAQASRPSGASQTGQQGRLNIDTRKQFLEAVHAALQDQPYLIIGGGALLEHGSNRPTADIDILVGEGFSKQSAESLLVKYSKGRIVRLGHGKMGFRAAGGAVFPLDISKDSGVDLPFVSARDTVRLRGSGVKIASIEFLLNAKAHAWQTRVPYEQQYRRQREADASDILFCLAKLQGRRGVDRSLLPWLYTNEFWVPFLRENRQAGPLFERAGLWTDQTQFSTSGSAFTGRSSRSSLGGAWSNPGTPVQRSGSGGGSQNSRLGSQSSLR